MDFTLPGASQEHPSESSPRRTSRINGHHLNIFRRHSRLDRFNSIRIGGAGSIKSRSLSPAARRREDFDEEVFDEESPEAAYVIDDQSMEKKEIATAREPPIDRSFLSTTADHHPRPSRLPRSIDRSERSRAKSTDTDRSERSIARSPIDHHPNRLPSPEIRPDPPSPPPPSTPAAIVHQPHELQKKEQVSRKQKAILEFFENVSIAGLKDTYTAAFLPERIMWYMAYVLVAVGIVVSTSSIARQYARAQKAVFDDQEVESIDYPFPDISICAPEAIEMERPLSRVLVPEKVREFIRVHKLDEGALVRAVVEFSTVNSIKPKLPNGTMSYVMQKIMDATYQSIPGGYPEYMTTIYPECGKTFGDECRIDGIGFDCCQHSRFVPFDNAVCYQMKVPQHRPSSLDDSLDEAAPTRSTASLVRLATTSGLILNLTIDRSLSTYTENVASDGFQVHIGPGVSVMSTPIAVPSGMDAHIVLGPAKRVIERTQCRMLADVPELTFFDHYDQYGTNCFANSIIEIFATVLGCAIPYLTLESRNMTPCGAEAMYLFSMFLEIDNVEMSGNNAQSRLYARSSEARKFCIPLCVRWEYPVISASYSRVQYATSNLDHSSQTWSLIKIYSPSNSYRIHKEEQMRPLYMLMCDIGLTLGSYAGISMITFAEILAYGFAILCVLPGFIRFKTKAKKRVKDCVAKI